MVAPTRVAIAASGLSALLLWAASPAVGASALAWVALAPAAYVVLANPGTRQARLAIPLTYALYLELLLVPSLPFGLTSGQWGDPPLPVLIGDSPVLVVALVAIPLFGLALYGVRFGQPWPGAATAALPLALVTCVFVPALEWIALEFIRVKLDPGGFWGPLFLTQAATRAGDLAVLAGPWLITAAVVAVGYGLALAAASGRALAAAVPVVAAAVLVLVGSAVAPGGGGAGLSVAAVQPGYDTAEEGRPVLRRWERGSYDRGALDVIADLERLERAEGRIGTDLIVWPEASMFVDPREEPVVAAALRAVAEHAGASLVAPYFVDARSRSAVLGIVPNPSGRGAFLTASRPKQRPMWFLGEAGGGEAPPAPLRLEGWRVGTMLGVDTEDPGIARALGAAGASLLVSSTHDWSALAVYQAAFARLEARAVGAPLVRTDWRYGSAIFGRDGEELVGAGRDLRRTVLVASVAPAARTPYTRVGDALAWLALATFAVLVGVRIARGRRR